MYMLHYVVLTCNNYLLLYVDNDVIVTWKKANLKLKLVQQTKK